METRHLLQTNYPDMRTAYDRLRMIPTSTNADIYLIRSHIAYWAGRIEAERSEIRPSRGHSYKATMHGTTYRVGIVNRYDHREGVVGFHHTDAEQQRDMQLMFS